MDRLRIRKKIYLLHWHQSYHSLVHADHLLVTTALVQYLYVHMDCNRLCHFSKTR